MPNNNELPTLVFGDPDNPPEMEFGSILVDIRDGLTASDPVFYRKVLDGVESAPTGGIAWSTLTDNPFTGNDIELVLANPLTTLSAPIVAESAQAGTLTLGTYRYKLRLNTLAGTLLGEQSEIMTVDGSHKGAVTVPSLPIGGVSIDLYHTPANSPDNGQFGLVETGVTPGAIYQDNIPPEDVVDSPLSYNNAGGNLSVEGQLSAGSQIIRNPGNFTELYLWQVRDENDDFLAGMDSVGTLDVVKSIYINDPDVPNRGLTLTSGFGISGIMVAIQTNGNLAFTIRDESQNNVLQARAASVDNVIQLMPVITTSVGVEMYPPADYTGDFLSLWDTLGGFAKTFRVLGDGSLKSTGIEVTNAFTTPSAPTAAESATAGVVSVGVHKVGLLYHTPSGTVLSDTTDVTNDGSHAIDLTVPALSVGITSIDAVMSKAGETVLYIVTVSIAPGGVRLLEAADVDLTSLAPALNNAGGNLNIASDLTIRGLPIQSDGYDLFIFDGKGIVVTEASYPIFDNALRYINISNTNIDFISRATDAGHLTEITPGIRLRPQWWDTSFSHIQTMQWYGAVTAAGVASTVMEGGGLDLPELPTTTDPARNGALFTCTAAELAALLGAGAKHVLLSKGSP